jgi:drug/metabolite transporter (DMT)-like permease
MLRSYFLIALSMCLVGGTVAVAKVLSDVLPVFVIGLLRCLIAALALLPWATYRYRGQFSELKGRVTQEDLLPIAGQALFGIFFFTCFLFYGIRSSNALNAGIISAALPALIALLSLVWLKEKLSGRKGISILLAIGGVLILNVNGATGSDSASLYGNGLIFLAVLSEAVYTIFAKQSASRLPIDLTALLVNLVGAALFAALAAEQLWALDWGAVSGTTWGLLVAYAIGSSVFALLLWYEGVRHVPANIAGLFTGFVPISAGLIAITFLGEVPHLGHGIGAGLIFLAIWLGASSGPGPLATQKKA